MFSEKDDTENDKQMQKNTQLLANQESDVQDGGNLESTKGDEKSIQVTLKGAEMNTKQIKTDFENNENDSIKDLSSVQSSVSHGHFFEKGKEEIANECVSADLVPGDDKTKTEDENDRISDVLEKSHHELLKSLLLEELEKATARLGFLERYKENVQQEIAKIKMIGLLRREQIKQEFDSFHDLLRQKEEKMLEQLDQEVNERTMHVINKLQASVVSLEKEDANLTSTVTELVQSSNDTRFLEDYARAKDLHKRTITQAENAGIPSPTEGENLQDIGQGNVYLLYIPTKGMIPQHLVPIGQTAHSAYCEKLELWAIQCPLKKAMKNLEQFYSCQQMDVRVKEFQRDWARNSMYTPSPVLDNYFTMRQEKSDLSEKLDEAMKLPKLSFKQNTLFTYPRSPVCLSELMEYSGVPPSTDVLYTMQLFYRRILIYELTSKRLQEMRLNDFSTFILVPGLTFLLKVTSENICHVLQDQSIRRTSSCQMLIRAKTPNFGQRRSDKSETAINENVRAALPDPNEIKLQTTTKTTATMRLAALKKLQSKMHNISRKKKEQNY